MIEYTKYPKTPRLYGGNCVITEKLHGTNGTLIFQKDGAMTCGSRNRALTRDKGGDNFGFLAWASERQRELFHILGEGVHSGEWCGPGIEGNNHELEERVFFLFDTTFVPKLDHYSSQCAELQLWHVPVLYEGKFTPDIVGRLMDELEHRGRWAEGVIVRLQSNQWSPLKVTFANDGSISEGKWKDV
jgi:hypothetical protein